MLTQKNAIIFGMAASLIAFIFPPQQLDKPIVERFFEGWAFIGSVPPHLCVDVPLLVVELLMIAMLTFGLYFLARID